MTSGDRGRVLLVDDEPAAQVVGTMEAPAELEK